MTVGPDHLQRFFGSRPAVAVSIALITAACTLQAGRLGWMARWELYAYDTFKGLLAPQAPADESVVMVWITEEDFGIHGHPLPDAVVAEALQRIVEREPRAVGLDIYRDVAAGVGLEDLRRVVLDHPEIVLVEMLPDRNSPGVPAPAFAPHDTQVGFVDLVRDPDGVTRRGFLYLWEEDGTAHASLSLQLARRYLARESIGLRRSPVHADWVALGETSIEPLETDFGGYSGIAEGGYQILIDYGRGPGSVPNVGLVDLLAGRVPDDILRDRVVILGTASPSVKDVFQSPSGARVADYADTAHSDPDGSILGAEIHAKIVSQLIHWGRGVSQPLRAPGESGEALAVAALALVGSGAGMASGSVVRIALQGIFGLGAVALAALLGFAQGWWLPIASPALAGIASYGLGVAYVSQRERREKAQVMQLFGRFVSRRIATQIWSQRSEFMKGGHPLPQRATVSILMTDLAGYTSACEKLEPGAVMRWIGDMMDGLAQEIEDHGAIVNDFMGDGVMATFGAPIVAESEAAADKDAEAAVRCGLAIARRLEKINELWRADDLPQARIRIGVLTGPAVLGALGSTERSKYATVGDVVNTASRLVDFDKQGFLAEPECSFRLLIGEETWLRVQGQFESERIGPRVLRGRAEPVSIYRIRGFAPGREPAHTTGITK